MLNLIKEKIYIILVNIRNKMAKKNNGFVEVKKNPEFLLASGNNTNEDVLDFTENIGKSLKERIIDKNKGYLYNLEFEYNETTNEFETVKTTIVFPDDWHIVSKDNVNVKLLLHKQEDKSKCYEISCNDLDNLIDYISKNIDIFTELAKQEQALRDELTESLKLLQEKKKLLIDKL